MAPRRTPPRDARRPPPTPGPTPPPGETPTPLADAHARRPSARASPATVASPSTARTRTARRSTKVFYLTDLVFANPSGRAGTIELRRGPLDLVTLRLENFRDLDFHYVTPIVVQPGETMTLVVELRRPGPCDPSVYYSGFSKP